MTDNQDGPLVLDRDRALRAFKQLILIRRFDERALQYRFADRILGTMHPYTGQEAVAVGVCLALEPDDRLVSNHRGHGHCIAKGADVNRMVAELFGRLDGFCKGKGGSMHIADFGIGMLGANGIVAAGLPIAAGSALAAQIRDDGSVTTAFFGDGSTGEGAFHEALNISALWKLPVIWVCENNQWAADTPLEESLPLKSVHTFGLAYGIPAELVDGTSVELVASATARAVARARAGGGPTILECRTFRWGVHAQRRAPIPEKRPAEVVAAGKERDPIVLFERVLLDRGVLDEGGVDTIRQHVEEELDEAERFAEASPYPSPEDALLDMMSPVL